MRSEGRRVFPSAFSADSCVSALFGEDPAKRETTGIKQRKIYCTEESL